MYGEILHDPAMRDPRGYILGADQLDFLTATKFVNTLIKAGVVVHRATGPFAVAGKNYPAGSYVVKTAQAFRPHVMDMFEPQDHPTDIPYPGGAPRPPYDVTGYTLAMSMGVKFDRVLEGFDGPFEALPDLVIPKGGTLTPAMAGGGYLLSHATNDAFVAVNRLLAAGEEVFWMKAAFTANGTSYPAGTMFISSKPRTLPVLQKVAADKGLSFGTVAARPAGDAVALKPVRIGLWDEYGGSITAGWTRWLLEQYEFPFERVFPKGLDAGKLAAKYDVLVFVDGAIPMRDGGGPAGLDGTFGGQPSAASIPAEFRDMLGEVSAAKTVPELKKFVEEGGTLLAIGSSTSIGYRLGLPIRNALVERVAGFAERPLPNEKFFVPGSILDARFDTTNPLAWGLEEKTNVFFDQSPAFRLLPDAALKGVRPVAWFDSATPLRSGWGWGQQFLDQAVAVVDATVGKGRVVLFGPEIVWRAQTHGTFKLLFNGIYYGPATSGVQGGGSSVF
jgi:hypothetical protein